MGALVKTVGTILHTQKLGDSHKLIEVLTPDFGRITLLARGARASKKRFAGILDVFVTLDLDIEQSTRMWSLVAAHPIALRLGIRQALHTIDMAMDVCSSCRELTHALQQSVDEFSVLNQALDAIAVGHLHVAKEAQPRLLQLAGFM